MAKTHVVVTLNGSNTNERRFVAELVQYLNTRNVEVVADELSLPENRVIHELLNHQWLILILTPETAKLRRIQAVVNAGLEYVEQGHLQGVLALTYGNTLIEPEEMPYPWWSTIRAYHAGESDEDHRRAFEKVHRTVSYVRVPALVGVSSTTNSRTPQDAMYDTRTSRPLLVQPSPAPKRRVPLRVLAISVLVLLSVFSGILIGYTFSKKGSSSSASATLTPNGHNNKATHSSSTPTKTSTAKASPSAGSSQNPTLIAKNLYDSIIKENPFLNDSMEAQDTNHPWDHSDSCMFKENQYQISSANSQYTPCFGTFIPSTYFAYQVQMNLLNGDGGGGLIFLSNRTSSTFYGFSLDSSGQYTLFECKQCTDPLNGGTGSKILKRGSAPAGIVYDIEKPTLLAVIVNDEHIYLYVNKMFVDQVNNLPITGSGGIGLYADSMKDEITQSVDVAFSNVQVWEINNSNGSNSRLS